MAVKRMGRRLFLAASGGTLAIPMMRSLLPPSLAKADMAAPRSIVIINTEHGGVLPRDFYPEGRPTGTDRVYGWEVRYGPLQRTVEGTHAKVSNVISAPADRLTSDLVQRFNVINGIDYAKPVGHNVSCHIGGYAQKNGVDRSPETRAQFKPTVDQLIGRSENFYQDAPAMPVVNIGHTGSAFYSNRASRTGMVVYQSDVFDPRAMWSALFYPAGRIYDDRPMNHALAVDQAYEGYRSLTTGAFGPARRLAGDDRERLEAHMATLRDVEVQIRAAAACDTPERPSKGELKAEWKARASLARQAIACGLSRVFSIHSTGTYTSVPITDFHHEVPHRSSAALRDKDGKILETVQTARTQIKNYYQGTFEHVVLPFIEALNFDHDGYNVLDESLLLWTSESGMETHHFRNLPLLTAGRMGGRVQAGQFLDYQNMAEPEEKGTDATDGFRFTGLPYDQLLGNLLQMCDVPREDYEHLLHRTSSGDLSIAGFGGYLNVVESWTHSEQVRLGADSPLPRFFLG